MANFTTTLLGSLSRIFASPLAPPPSTHPDKSSIQSHESELWRPCPPGGPRARPISTIGRYWSWEGPCNGMILRRSGVEQEWGLTKCLPDATITHTSPVLLIACQPPHALALVPPACKLPPSSDAAADSAEALDPIIPTCTAIHDSGSSFDISLISDTSTAISDESDSYDFTEFALEPLPVASVATTAAVAPVIGLGIDGLFKPDGSAFDGMGIVSFGCSSYSADQPPSTDSGVSRTLLEEALRTWAADPQHRMLAINSETDVVTVDTAIPDSTEKRGPSRRDANSVRPSARRTTASQQENKPRGTIPLRRLRTRDLSALNTISSELKRRKSSTPPPSAAVTVASRPLSVVPVARRAATPVSWRS